MLTTTDEWTPGWLAAPGFNDEEYLTTFMKKYLGVFFKADIRKCFQLNPRFLT